MAKPQTAIRARRLSKAFDGRPVLDAIDVEIAAGESVALTGVNGAGKTTLLGCLASVLRPDGGEVRWFGQPVGRDVTRRRWIGMVAHESGLYPHLTLRENLLFAARMGGIGSCMASRRSVVGHRRPGAACGYPADAAFPRHAAAAGRSPCADSRPAAVAARRTVHRSRCRRAPSGC